jgi:hypothetical protein
MKRQSEEPGGTGKQARCEIPSCLNRSFFDDEQKQQLKDYCSNSTPYQHVVLDKLANDEFMRRVRGKQQSKQHALAL